jgi:hypothetical protein
MSRLKWEIPVPVSESGVAIMDIIAGPVSQDTEEGGALSERSVSQADDRRPASKPGTQSSV